MTGNDPLKFLEKCSMRKCYYHEFTEYLQEVKFAPDAGIGQRRDFA